MILSTKNMIFSLLWTTFNISKRLFWVNSSMSQCSFFFSRTRHLILILYIFKLNLLYITLFYDTRSHRPCKVFPAFSIRILGSLSLWIQVCWWFFIELFRWDDRSRVLIYIWILIEINYVLICLNIVNWIDITFV